MHSSRSNDAYYRLRVRLIETLVLIVYPGTVLHHVQALVRGRLLTSCYICNISSSPFIGGVAMKLAI